MKKRLKGISLIISLLALIILGGTSAKASEQYEDTLTMAEVLDQNEAELSETEITGIAVGTSRRLTLENVAMDPSTYQITYTSENSKVASVASDGTITAVAAGTTNINLTISFTDQSYRTYSCKVTVTNPSFTQSTYVVAVGGELSLQVKGSNSEIYDCKVNDESIASVSYWYDLSVVGNKVGTTTIQATVDGKVITATVQVTNPTIKDNLKLIVKGKSANIKVTGKLGKTKVTYQIANSKIASISSSGKIKGKKYGSTVVTVSVDNTTIPVVVAVGKTKTIGAIKNAVKALGKPYSQPKRMQKGYYDCSSLVWRSYKPYKVYFGDKKYAPTAANQGKYLVQKKKVIAKKYVDPSKLQPGDVLYFTKGKNGRYRNIYHTAIYIGEGVIIHANGAQVAYGSYSYYQNRIALITRPTK